MDDTRVYVFDCYGNKVYEGDFVTLLEVPKVLLGRVAVLHPGGLALTGKDQKSPAQMRIICEVTAFFPSGVPNSSFAKAIISSTVEQSLIIGDKKGN